MFNMGKNFSYYYEIVSVPNFFHDFKKMGLKYIIQIKIGNFKLRVFIS